MKRIRKAKIIATLGPSSSDFKTIKKFYYAGADIFRLNFSHDIASTHVERFKQIRNLEKKINRPIGILMDLQGPKLRVGKFSSKNTASEFANQLIASKKVKNYFITVIPKK